MQKIWNKIFVDYIACYEAIKTLEKNHLMDDEEVLVYKANLLKDIIETIMSEVEE